MTDFCVNCGNKELSLICVECHTKVLKLYEDKQRTEFLEDLKHKTYYWKGYRNTLIEKWEGK